MILFNKESKHAILYILGVSLVANMVHSVTPLLIQTLGFKDYMFGVMFACMSGAALFFSPLWGSISDTKSRKLPLVIGPMVYAIAQFGFSYFKDPFLICVCRFLAGTGSSAMFGCSFTYLSDYLDAETRTKSLSTVMALQALASACGYLVGGFIGNVNYLLTFYLQVIFIVMIGVYAMFFLKDKKKEVSNKTKLSDIFDLKSYKSILFSITGVIFILFFIECFSYNSYNSAIGYFISSILLIDPRGIGFYMAAIGVIGLLNNAFLIPRLMKTMNEVALLLISSVVCAVLLIVAIITTNIVLISLFFMIIYAALRIVFKPVITSMVLKREENKGKALGLLNSMESLGGVAGSLVAGFAFEINPLFPFVVAAILLSILFLMILKSRKLLVE